MVLLWRGGKKSSMEPESSGPRGAVRFCFSFGLPRARFPASGPGAMPYPAFFAFARKDRIAAPRHLPYMVLRGPGGPSSTPRSAAEP